MYTSIDEAKGTVRCQWEDVRERVKLVEPEFFDIVEQLSPDKDLPLYLVYLPYGSLKGDSLSSFLVDSSEKFIRLTDATLPQIIKAELGYGKTSSPLGMVLEKELEYFIELENENFTIPFQIHKAGAFFNYPIIAVEKSPRVYCPNGILKVSAGCRSVFMLPNIGCVKQHTNIQRDFNISTPAPKKVSDQWRVFKDLVNSKELNYKWNACILYFSEAWIKRLTSDPAWLGLKLYLFSKERKITTYQLFNQYYDFIFSIIQKNRNLKPNPYLMDTVRHTFNISLGFCPGFVPACDESSLPVSLLKQAYVNSYGLSKYIPTLMKPSIYAFEEEKYPIYYSLQLPTTHAFSPKSRSISSTFFEFQELIYLMKIFCNELSQVDGLCSGTIFEKFTKQAKFSYFHNKKDSHSEIKLSSTIIAEDPRFNIRSEQEDPAAVFSADAKFLRGCIAISNNRRELISLANYRYASGYYK